MIQKHDKGTKQENKNIKHEKQHNSLNTREKKRKDFKFFDFCQGSWPPSNTWFFGPTQLHIPNGIVIGSANFAQLTVESPHTLHGAATSPQKMYLLIWRSG